MVSERTQHIEKTMVYLDQAMKDSRLKEMVAPRYKILQNILQKGRSSSRNHGGRAMSYTR